MTITTERESFNSLSLDEKRAWNDAAEDRVRALSREMVATANARKPDPHAGEYLAWRTMELVCILVVKHRDAPASIEVSRDGGAASHIYLPKSKTLALPDSEGDFLLALLSRSFVKWIAAKEPAAGQRFRELFGVTLPLAADRDWTESQCASWQRLDSRRMSINARIQAAKSRTKYSTLTRSQVA